MVSAFETQSFFIESEITTSILSKLGFSALNNFEESIDGDRVKGVCVKIKAYYPDNISLKLQQL